MPEPNVMEPPVPSLQNMPQVFQKITDDFASAVAGLKEEVKNTFRNTSEQMVVIERRIEELVKAQNAMPQVVEFGDFDPGLLKNSHQEPDGGREVFNQLLRCGARTGRPELDSLITGLQKASDEFYLSSQFQRIQRVNNGGGDFTRGELEALTTFKKFNRMRQYLANALDTQTALEGGNWIPVGMSAQVIEKVALQLQIANLFGSFQMPGPTFDWPFETALPVAKLMSGVTSTTRGELLAPVDPYASTYLSASDELWSGAPTGKVTFTANKLRALAVLSREVSDDMIIATMPWLVSRIAYAIASGWEDAVVNGDTTATHMDTDTTGATSVRKAIMGIRQFLYGAAGIGASTGGVDCGGASTAPTAVKLRSVRAKMGVFGQQLNDLAWICSPVGSIHLLNMAEVLTVDKLGAGATVLKGQLGAFDNIPIYTSGYKRDDVNNVGVNGASGNTFTSIECVYKPNFLWGERPGLGVETERMKLTDQSFAVMFSRRAFRYIGASTDRVVGGLYNIPNTV